MGEGGLECKSALSGHLDGESPISTVSLPFNAASVFQDIVEPTIVLINIHFLVGRNQILYDSLKGP